MTAPSFEICLVCRDMRPDSRGGFRYLDPGQVLVSECPATIQRFLVYRIVGQDNADHTVTYETEAPDGTRAALVQAPASSLPRRLRERFPNLPPEAVTLPPEPIKTRIGQHHTEMRYFELTASTPGEYHVHVLVDGQRERHAVFIVEESAD